MRPGQGTLWSIIDGYLLRYGSSRYSYRRATIGSALVARREGT